MCVCVCGANVTICLYMEALISPKLCTPVYLLYVHVQKYRNRTRNYMSNTDVMIRYLLSHLLPFFLLFVYASRSVPGQRTCQRFSLYMCGDECMQV